MHQADAGSDAYDRDLALHVRQSVKSLFGLTDDDGVEGEENTPIDAKD
jgi:hypothetical protein